MAKTIFLQKEDKDADDKKNVSAWQKFLFSQGFLVTVDGDFGNITARMTNDFKLLNNLPSDGLVDKKTVDVASKKGFGGFE